VPLVLDADALQADIVSAGTAPRIVTPHAGEFARIRESVEASDKTVVVLKGPHTQVKFGGTNFRSFFGGPVLARGGSGDLLAGLTGGLLAQAPEEPLLAAARGVVWHGLAADYLARAHGQTAVQITQLLDFLAPALKECANEP
jgi:NAD(P)H-hydrate epimerase